MQYLKEKRFSKNIFKNLLKADNILPFIFFFLLIYASLTLLFGQNNIFKFIKVKEEKERLIKQIEAIKKENQALQEKIHDLKYDKYTIEKKAREDLGLMKDGEEIFVIIEDKKEKKEKSDKWIDKIKNIYKEYYLKN